MEKITRCKKCNTEFTTKIICFTTTKQYIVNDKTLNPDHEITTRTTETKRPQYTNCELCRNMQKALNYLNGMI